MSTDLENMRKLGQTLADHVNSLQEPSEYSVLAMQAIAADLIDTSGELLIPTMDLLGRPSFRRLVRFAGTGSGSIHRNALLNELETIYGAKTLSAMSEFMNGFLGIPSGVAPDAERSHRLVKKKDVSDQGKDTRRRRRPWTMLPVDTEDNTWHEPSELADASVIPPYLLRRASTKSFNIARAIFFFPPLSLVLGIRHRSWRLGLIPLCTALLVGTLFDQLFQILSLSESWKLISSLSTATIACHVAHGIAKQNMHSARQLLNS